MSIRVQLGLIELACRELINKKNSNFKDTTKTAKIVLFF